jgi:hypothetical protein
MKKVVLLLSLVVFLTVSCVKNEQESQVSDVSFTPCQQTKSTKSEVSDKVDVEFTNEGVKVTYCNFGVTCDFTIVNVTHTFVSGVLNISQESYPNQANCICFTDVSYTINGISQDDVNVIFINGEQVYCHNEKPKDDPKDDPLNASHIMATNVENITSDVKGVFAQLLYYLWNDYNNYWYMAGLQYLYNEGVYKNGCFEIGFPDSFSNEFLGPFEPYHTLSSGGTVILSDINAKTGLIYLHASTDHYGTVTKNYSPVGKFVLVGDGWIVDYLFSDRSFTVKGISEYGLEFDCSFNKGWNIMYTRKDYSKITTNQPSNEYFKWYFRP